MSTKFIILGCGSSLGIPRIDGYFGSCNPKNKKNYRTRCCALISNEKKNILIDTSPDIKYQLLRHKIKNIDDVFYTHMHGDQTHGINELRVYYLKNRKRINVYADKDTKEYLKNSFTYCFKGNFGYPPIMKLNILKKKHKYKKLLIESFSVEHGKVNSALYLVNKKCAYASDVSYINKPFNDIKKSIEKTPRTKIVELEEDYLHAEVTSKWMKYVDDLEISYIPESQKLIIRSESRVGDSDLGVNQKRVDLLKSNLF